MSRSGKTATISYSLKNHPYDEWIQLLEESEYENHISFNSIVLNCHPRIIVRRGILVDHLHEVLLDFQEQDQHVAADELRAWLLEHAKTTPNQELENKLAGFGRLLAQ
jgi:hypothetical protein